MKHKIDKETGEITVSDSAVTMGEIPHTPGEVYQKGVFLRTENNYNMDLISEQTGLKCEDATKAQQQFKDETDINVIVERFGITGELPKDVRAPAETDFWEVSNYQEALNQVTRAREAFMEMPAKIREEFNNDPGEFLAFVHNDKNKERAKEMGILVPEKEAPKEPAPQRVIVVQEPDRPAGDTKK